METSIKVNYKYTANLYKAKQWLDELPDLIACDFEASSKFTELQKEAFKLQLETEEDEETKRVLNQYIKSDGLSHPSLSTLTHVSIAWSESDALVILLPSDKLKQFVVNWLVTTTRKQVWHNLSFDAKHIMYLSGKFPQNYEDTQLLAKTIVNHVEVFKAKTGLKELAGAKYGDWGISSDYFKLEDMYKENVIKYAATDACATFWLWNSIQRHLKGE